MTLQPASKPLRGRQVRCWGFTVELNQRLSAEPGQGLQGPQRGRWFLALSVDSFLSTLAWGSYGSHRGCVFVDFPPVSPRGKAERNVHSIPQKG